MFHMPLMYAFFMLLITALSLFVSIYTQTGSNFLNRRWPAVHTLQLSSTGRVHCLAMQSGGGLTTVAPASDQRQETWYNKSVLLNTHDAAVLLLQMVACYTNHAIGQDKSILLPYKPTRRQLLKTPTTTAYCLSKWSPAIGRSAVLFTLEDTIASRKGCLLRNGRLLSVDWSSCWRI